MTTLSTSRARPTVVLRPPSREPIWSLAARANPATLVRLLWRERHLIRQLTWREVTGRYRSSALGIGWSFATPLIQLALYTFVFGVVLQTRWPGATSTALPEFGLMLFAGITAFSVFSECVNRAPGLIASSPNYVKKVVFPLEVLPVGVLGSALFHAGVSLAILLVARAFILSVPLWTAILLPIVLVPLVCLSLGLSWFLASLGVFLRDIGHTVALVTQMLMFLTPIFYPPGIFPARLRFLVDFNPLASIVENMRRAAVQGMMPDWKAWAYTAAVGFIVLCLGYAWFAKSKRAFADVI
jgi:lipopolysaccharide transport system permease protein